MSKIFSNLFGNLNLILYLYKITYKNMKLNREGFLVSKDMRQCTNKDCGIIFKKTSKTVTLCNRCNSNRVKCTDIKYKMFSRAKSRAKQRNIEFNLNIEDIIIPEYCPVLNIKLVEHKGKPGGIKNSPALDRINNSLGYIKGNVVVISHLANMMKSSANNEELLKFAEWVNNTLAKE